MHFYDGNICRKEVNRVFKLNYSRQKNETCANINFSNNAKSKVKMLYELFIYSFPRVSFFYAC